MATRGQVNARDSRTMAIQFDQGEFEEGHEELTQCAERLGHYHSILERIVYLTGNEITKETICSVCDWTQGVQVAWEPDVSKER